MEFTTAVFNKASDVMVRGNSHAAGWYCTWT